MPNPIRQRHLLPGAFAVIALAAAPAPRTQGTPPFEESIDVVETSVLVGPAEGLRRFSDRDWQVSENGEARKVDRVELVRGEPWELVIWVDGPLCDQAALSRTVIALAFAADELTAAGTVKVIAAAPEPRVVLDATRDAAALVQALAGLAREPLCTREVDSLFWRARGLPKGAPPDPAPPTAAAAATALADLRGLVEARAGVLVKATPACGAAGCAVLLVSHGYPLDADLRLPAEIRPADAAQIAASLTAATEGLARRLALVRWQVVALPFAPRPSLAEDEEADRPLEKEARPGPEPFPDIGGDHGPPGVPTIPRRVPAIEPPAAAYDVYILPEIAPLRRLADLTAGAVLRVPDQIAGMLETFANRRRLWYRTSPFAAGEARTLEVRVKGRRAEAPAWIGKPQ